jgi:mannose/fructose/N-acetylgalactosamine-specific phosphotransferase system component IID
MGGGIMTIYEIGFLMVGWSLSIVFFYSMGVDAGYKEGRRAVRKFYEQRDKVRA